VSDVLAEVQDGVSVITLNRVSRANAWTYELEDLLFDCLDAADNDPAVRVIVITGAGQSFCPGLDVDVLAARANGAPPPVRRRPATHLLTIRKPVIAAINGACAGIGLVQALLCDVRFGVAGAKLTTAATRRGLVGEFGLPWMLERLVGHGHASDLLLSGRVVTAEEAAAMGLLNRVYDAIDTLTEGTLAYARDIAAHCSPASMAETKRQLVADWYRTREASEAEATFMLENADLLPDFAEGVASFQERRPPQFAGLSPREALA
jgi:enoyl-CoA hydratase/carnithine racemase